jgi:2-polyprenyl-6-methoxyphenol hydroxylase-like FAD-dependent oxidoreductase
MTRAIVIGSSLAGMCVARVLVDYFDDVVILERDSIPEGIEHRAGVPQSRHAHVLLSRGQRELDGFFPGFSAALRAAGAPCFDPGVYLATRREPGWQDVGSTDDEAVCCSRVLLEFTVRRLLREQHSKVRILERTQVMGLLRSAEGARAIRGVRLRNADKEQLELSAELVVDSSGRASHAHRWLSELGISPPESKLVDAHAGYASRLYQAPAQPPASWWWKGLWIEWEPPHLPRGGVIFPLEGNRWYVTLLGIGDDRPPVDVDGFEAFMKTVSTPALAEAVALATPLSEVAGSRSLSNVFRRYDRWSERLPGFLAVGDAVCAFNPIYGQGMSSAAACAAILRDELRTRSPSDVDFEVHFFRAQGRFLKDVWTMSTGADFRWPGTAGKRPRHVPILSAYLALAMGRLHGDAALRRRATPVFNLRAPLTRFLEPSFVLHALLSAARGRVEAMLRPATHIPDAPPRPACLATVRPPASTMAPERA